jgi:hypothetical protein
MNDATPLSADRHDASIAGAELPGVLARHAASLIESQRAWLTSAGAIVTDWFDRQRQAVDLSSRSWQRVWECRSLADLLRAQQQSAGEWLRWTAAEWRAAGRDADTMTQNAAAQMGEGGRAAGGNLRRRQAVPQPDPVPDRAAAK